MDHEMQQSDLTARTTRSKTVKLVDEVVYKESIGFPSGVLPLKRDVAESMLYLMRPARAGRAQRGVEGASMLLAHTLVAHWEHCNIYTITIYNIQNRIQKLWEEFRYNYKIKGKKQTDSWKRKMVDYNKSMNTLFDIFCENESARRKREAEAGVSMGPDEFAFLQDMRNERKMYCEDFLDKVWQKQRDRQLAKDERFRKLNEAKDKHETSIQCVSWDDVNLEHEEVRNESEESDFDPRQTENPPSATKRRKLIPHSSAVSVVDEIMPHKYCHLRTSIKIVKPEYYVTVDKIMSTLHCTKTQAIGAVIHTANGMFGRNWKFHDEDPSQIDLNTAPSKKQVRVAGQALTALCLSAIVDEMMDNGGAVITYHDDGSRQQGVGGYSVQGITINGKFRPLPTLPIASESRKNLAALKLAILTIMCTCNDKYSEEEVYKAITYKVTDSTAHNFEVDEIVALELHTDHIPTHLLCHTHPVLMFNRKMVEVFSKIEKEIGPDKIYSSFLVNATTSHDSVTEQYIDCLTRLVSHDFDHKSWNKASEFDIHISPEKNIARSLRKERFNRFVYLAAVALHYQDPVSEFLSKYNTITNTLACIVRAFEDVEFISVFLVVAALLGIHLIEPYLSCTYYDPLSYEDLIPTMCQLYEDLKTTPAEALLDIGSPAFRFVSKERFSSSNRWEKCVVQSVIQATEKFKEKILSVLKLLLPALAEGFFTQRGDVFGFGEFDPSSSKLVTNYNMEELNKAPINNLDSERCVGAVNYELGIRGAKQLQAASSSLVKGKSYDLIELKSKDQFRQYKSTSKKVNSLVQSFKLTQENLMKEGMTKKQTESLTCERRKLKDLEQLRKLGGPFTRAEDVQEFLVSSIPEKDKQARLYLEVRFARDTALCLPKSSDIFRLKQQYKMLSSDKLGKNLLVFLSKVSANATATWSDFDTAIVNLLS